MAMPQHGHSLWLKPMIENVSNNNALDNYFVNWELNFHVWQFPFSFLLRYRNDISV